jgi:ABC-type uncharacterized transport system substrate-binding protein
MRVIGLAVVFTLSLSLASLEIDGQPQTEKVYKIGVIMASGAAADAAGPNPRHQSIAVLLRRLRDLGYVHGRDFVTKPGSAEGMAERSPTIALELVRRNVDVIVAGGPALSGVKEAGIATLVVMSGIGSDPVTTGYVTSLAHPGGNFTGLTLQHLELDRKRLQLLTELIPGAVRWPLLESLSR